MSRAAGADDRRAIQLMINCLEARRAVCSPAVLQRFPEAASVLRARGLLKPAGYEAVTADDDVPLALKWAPESGEFGYFSETKGWTTVANDGIRLFALDTRTLMNIMTAKLDMAKRDGFSTLVKDHLWELGELRVKGTSQRVSLLFGRRLRDEIWDEVQTVLRSRPSAQSRIVLTSTPPQHWPKSSSLCRFVSVASLFEQDNSFAVEPERISAAVLEPVPHGEDSQLRVIGDGREVRFKGKTYRFTKGFQQRRVIRLLHQRYLDGEQWVSSAEIIEEAGLGGSRIRDLFKKSQAWDRLLTERGGMCGFCWEEIQQD